MQALKDFYTIISIEKLADGLHSAKIRLNKDHEIFQGHFPGNPVTPGVCMMQIAKEITQQITEKRLMLSSASNVKFMAIINPEIHPELVLELSISETEDEIKVKNTTFFGDTTTLKMNLNYKIIL